MPKGGDLHNHLGGAIYAENLIGFAVQDRLCLDRRSLGIVSAACDTPCNKESAILAAQCADRDQELYNSIVDAWSIRNWERGYESGHDHFFSTFSKFERVFENHTGEFIAVAMNQAAADHLQYLELMHTIGGSSAALLGAKLNWDGNFSEARQKLIANGFEENISQIRKQLDGDEQTARKKLACGSDSPEPGCQVTTRYLYQVLRGFPPEQVFAQILTGFKLASVDPRVV
ncbi:MAG: adenosine deaminase, partial [Acidobacteria bacterium]